MNFGIGTMTKESSVFFPEEMRFVEMAVPFDTAYHCVRALTGVNLVHMVDANVEGKVQEKRYTEEYMRCEDAERSLRYIQSQLEQYNMLPEKPSWGHFEAEAAHCHVSWRNLSTRIEELDISLHERIQSTQQLEARVAELETALEALRFYRPLIMERERPSNASMEEDGSMELELIVGRQLLFSITGVMESHAMQRMFVAMYRASRGNIITSRGSDESGKKGYFTIWFQTELLRKKVTQIAESFGAKVFGFPVDDEHLDAEENRLSGELTDTSDVLRQSYADNKRFLVEVRDHFWFWRLFFAKEIMIIQHMDFADFARIDNRAVYMGWVPLRRLDELEPLLDEATLEAGSAARIAFDVTLGNDTPPTWIETNEFTSPFQMLCDAYGFADYDEVNAGAFYAMYPFLFGIMFGDIGHSLVFLVGALGLVFVTPVLRKKGVSETMDTILGARWFLLLLAICGIYNGFVYNEVFGIPIDVFGGKYESLGNGTYVKKDASVYAFGVDPVWMFKDNELIYSNSLKMKISVVMGITMMVFGMFLAFIKQVRRRAWIELFLGWVPQMMYLCSFFVYMVCLIIMKWCTKATGGGVNIIQVLISMMLSPTNLVEEQVLYDHQQTIQNVIAIVFVASIPLMLIVKPIVEMCVHGVGSNGILECFVITLIEVIEFTLSALSHTASFLRLWALSLAHSQLSHVLYDQLFVLTLKMGPFPFFIGFAAWAGGTVAIIMGMESFSSLLHGIRLMWVEFSSKFYSGTGYEFKPVSFEREFKLIPSSLGDAA